MTVFDVVSRYFDGDVVCEGTFVSWEEAADFRRSVLAWRAATEVSLPSVGIEPREVVL